MVEKITQENFESLVLNNEKTVLLDFWASWCGPCRMLSPVVDEVATETPDIFVGKVNVDEEPDLAAQFGISSIPTLLVFKNKSVVKKSIGFIPKESVLDLVK